ncbi:MAG: hypothetical protein ABIG44_00865 [Planctomycetota bacterium]
MSSLDSQIGRARQRLMTNVFLRHLARGVLVAAALWTLLLLVERAFVLNIPIGHGIWMVAVVGAVVTLVGTVQNRIDEARAAVAIDVAAGLKERLSSAYAVRRDTDPFAQAVVRDAEHTASRVHVPAHLPLRAPSLWPWSTTVVLMAVILGFFMPTLDLLAGQDDEEDPAEKRAAVEAERHNINKDIEARLNRIKEMGENNPGLKDLAKELEPLEMPDTPSVTPEDIRREAVKRLDKVTERLEQEKDAGMLEAMMHAKRMLSQLQPQQGQNSVDELNRSLASGDFEGAKKALEAMQEQLKEAAAKGDAESKQRLEQMQQQLRKMADQLAKLDDATYLRKELENKAGLTEEQARKLMQELANMDPKQLQKELQRQLGDQGVSQKQIQELVKKFQQQQQAKKSCQNMGQCLAQAAQAMQQCQNPGSGAGASQAAAAALTDAMSQLSELEMSEQLMAELEAQMADLQDMRDSVCNGNYCRGARPGDKVGPQGPNYGLGIGARIGKERTPHAMTPTKAKSRGRGGTIIGQMLVDGPQVRGEATAEVQNTVNAAQRDAQDAIDRDTVPRQYHGAVQKYFEQLAGLLSGEKKPESSTDPESDPDPEPAPESDP